MSNETKKTYVFTSGKHHTPEKVYKKGDKIELTDEEAKGLVNKVIDPEAAYGLTVESSAASDESLKERIAALEAEKEALEERVAELEDEV